MLNKPAIYVIHTYTHICSPESCEQGGRQLFFMPAGERVEQQESFPAAGQLDMTAVPADKVIDWDDDEEAFTILDEPGLGVAVSWGLVLYLVWHFCSGC